ncbi:MAG: type II toxin-antitoxin system VapC family toxin [Candidatus Woesearchaeota archaeon]|jgi:predicted nucleic acid-binding protein|nr:type II toxin-antitoxin system VapC family toxin [Candidatus Woesearchaeota archaeon]MDP7182176.1 type II toxin-antitoxin system VapC family toxin [Candidatus Woesearchaeota archaeon]MDP7199313.1 type II toxin-antitoxin system VapC family toxin [Candidatus Woesearchaeota archaeon]MDP7467952.1 type II toxin-antitoxin system VapC family toxin [Candidatus Woesearchaeota archaeon]MDP7647576.1 type II toxin-antitoxin system VapC family toxin [Candidatus Woesearchaeota archaeon]|tara:strand:- start:425 stop:823 length:399 start_codon:yes stop_codon:yes gene_type:complete
MAKEKKVVDASVLVKLFAKEEGTNSARDLRAKHVAGEIVLVTTSLAFLEVMNGLRYARHRTGSLQKHSADLWDLSLVVPTLSKETMARTVAIAEELSLSVYDALYLATARNLGCSLITADKALAQHPPATLL